MRITIETHDSEIASNIEKEAGKRGIVKPVKKYGDIYSIELNESGYLNARANIDGFDIFPHPDEMRKGDEYKIRLEEYANNEKIRRIGIGNSVLREELSEREITDIMKESSIYPRF